MGNSFFGPFCSTMLQELKFNNKGSKLFTQFHINALRKQKFKLRNSLKCIC